MKTIPNDPRVQKLTFEWSRVTQVYCKSRYISTGLEGKLNLMLKYHTRGKHEYHYTTDAVQ
jgi:hypothetical protein